MAHLTQSSIDKIATHAGKLDLILQHAGTIARAIEEENMSALTDAALHIGQLWSRKLSNDCCDIFKQLYNREIEKQHDQRNQTTINNSPPSCQQ